MPIEEGLLLLAGAGELVRPSLERGNCVDEPLERGISEDERLLRVARRVVSAGSAVAL